MRVVVTGGAGFIGSHLVDALLERTDHTVLVVDNLRRGTVEHLERHRDCGRLTTRVCDIRQAEVCEQAFQDAEVVFHLAAQSNVLGAVTDPRESFESNVVGTFNVLQAAREQGVRRVVFASSREAYGESPSLPVREEEPLTAKNTYGASKVAAEAFCQTFTNTFGLETAILRFANVYGPRDRDRVIPLWIERALRGDPLEIYGGRQVLDFVWVDLVVEALLRAADAPIVGVPINVGSGVGIPIHELATRILDATGSRGSIRVLPARQAEVTCFVADVSRLSRYLGLVPDRDPLAHLERLLPLAVTHT